MLKTKELRNFDQGLSKLEYRFNEVFKDQIDIIYIHQTSENPLLLAEVLTMGFNNVALNGKIGYEPADFTDEELSTEVKFDYWEDDDDNYRTVYLKAIED